MFQLKKKLNVCLSHNFQTRFHNADHIFYYPQKSVFSFHTCFCSLISVSKKRNIETMLTLPFLKIGKSSTTK